MAVKKLELFMSKEEYTDQQGNKREYNKFYTIVNGIEVQLTLSAGDRTGRVLLVNYFNGTLL